MMVLMELGINGINAKELKNSEQIKIQSFKSRRHFIFKIGQ